MTAADSSPTAGSLSDANVLQGSVTNKKMTDTYGLHLTLRIAGVERRAAMNGAQAVADLLTTLVDRIGMRILAGPLTGEEAGDADHSGWSGVVILYESHAAIHTYPERGEAFLDVFSCKDYSVALVRDVLAEFLGDFCVVEELIQDRGHHWDAGVQREMAGWRGRR